jgi:hypothetical protein
VCDENDVNQITGAERPEDFQVHNKNSLFYMLEDIVSEIQWLTSEGYEWVGEDLDWARYLLVSVALAMREPLARLLVDVVSVYQAFEKEDFAHPRSRIPESEYLLGEVGEAAWKAALLMSEEDITDHARKCARNRKEQEARVAVYKAKQSNGTPYNLNDAPLQTGGSNA